MGCNVQSLTGHYGVHENYNKIKVFFLKSGFNLIEPYIIEEIPILNVVICLSIYSSI